MKYIPFLFLLFFLSVSASAQNYRKLEIKTADYDTANNLLPFATGDTAVSVFYSDIEGVNIKSSIGGLYDYYYDEGLKGYVVFTSGFKQILLVSHASFVGSANVIIDPVDQGLFSYRLKTKDAAEMLSKYGKLSINTEPSGFNVEIDHQKAADNTPFSNYYNPGSYSVRLHRKGYKDFDTALVLVKGEETELNVKPVSNFAELIIKSSYAARIKINGKLKGIEKVVYDHDNGGIEPGIYEIEIIRNKHIPVTKTVELTVGERKELDLPLKPMEGYLDLYTTIEGIEIQSNLPGIDSVPFSGSVLIGDYKLKFSKENHISEEVEFQIRQGDWQFINVDLQTYEGKIKKYKNVMWSMIVLSASTGASGGYFFSRSINYRDMMRYEDSDFDFYESQKDISDKIWQSSFALAGVSAITAVVFGKLIKKNKKRIKVSAAPHSKGAAASASIMF